MLQPPLSDGRLLSILPLSSVEVRGKQHIRALRTPRYRYKHLRFFQIKVQGVSILRVIVPSATNSFNVSSIAAKNTGVVPPPIASPCDASTIDIMHELNLRKIAQPLGQSLLEVDFGIRRHIFVRP